MNKFKNETKSNPSLTDIEFRELLGIYTGEKRELLKKIESIISPNAEKIASTFYEEMLKIPETEPFLDNNIVNKRLRQSMSKWIKYLFTPQNEKDISMFLQKQLEVGNVHARINIPMHLVNHGIRILKRQCDKYLIQGIEDKSELAEAVIMVNELLDYSVASVNESYMNDLVENERNAQSLQMHTTGHGLAIECERMRSVLFDWLRKVLTYLYKKRNDESPPSVYSSDFGLWVMYKADILFADYRETIAKLKKQMKEIENILQNALNYRKTKKRKACSNEIEKLNKIVTGTGWLLSSFVDHTLEMESGRDPLTRLFNRRYMNTILQKTVKTSLMHKVPFAVLLFDIDHFKRVNDTFGHEAGDTILTEFSELLASKTRTSDYVFRYGGEEFLVLLNGANAEMATSIAKKIRHLIATTQFTIKQDKTVSITTSIGVASHDGHPDYSRIINQADKALYQAKNSGRNRVVTYSNTGTH